MQCASEFWPLWTEQEMVNYKFTNVKWIELHDCFGKIKHHGEIHFKILCFLCTYKNLNTGRQSLFRGIMLLLNSEIYNCRIATHLFMVFVGATVFESFLLLKVTLHPCSCNVNKSHWFTKLVFDGRYHCSVNYLFQATLNP